MRRLTSPKPRDLSTRRTLEPDWPKTESQKLADEEQEDSDPYPDSDSAEINLRRKSSKF